MRFYNKNDSECRAAFRPVQRMMVSGGQSNSRVAFVKPAHRKCCFERWTGHYTAPVGILVTDRKSAHWDSYQ